jgi:hypothetical protein
MCLSKRDNTLQTLRYLIDGGLDRRYHEVNNLFIKIIHDVNLYKLLNGWYIQTNIKNNIVKSNSGIKFYL